MIDVELFVGLLIAAIPLVGLARRWQIPYPIVLVLGGLVLGFVPLLPPIVLNPDLVLLIFLPPLLFWESVTAPTDEMRSQARSIWPLAIGLVLATTAGVAAVVHTVVPAIGWATAFVLGAIVAPTDELAAAPTAERLGVPRHVIAIIEGESLLNDAASLVIYTAAVAAVVTGTFSWQAASLTFVLAALGAVAIGIVVGLLAVAAWRQFTDTQLQAVISVLVPFIAYVPAQHLHVSGVLAVVTAGVFVNRHTPRVITPQARVQLDGWWETSVFLANAVIFILIGLSLRSISISALSQHHSWPQLFGIALAVNVAIIGVRFVWVFAQAAFPLPSERSRRGEWKHLVVTALCGMRGAVSLAAALAIPAMTVANQPFPERDLLLFVTFSVILVTLVGGGLTLPVVIRALRIPPDDTEEAEVRRALLAADEAALRRLEELERAGRVDPEHAQALRERYATRRARVVRSSPEETRLALQRYLVELELIAAQREVLVRMRERGEIENNVLRRLQLTLDMAQTEIERLAGNVRDIIEDDGADETGADQVAAGFARSSISTVSRRRLQKPKK
jgi:monovalent cation/hydrogen antiporter